MTTFEFDIKAGNRATRRLGKPSIGRMARTATNARFDPNAFDGDGDNLVQDNTPFERPASPTSAPQGLASVSPSRNQADNRLASLPINPDRVRPRIALRKNNPTVQRVKGKRPKGYRDHLRGRSVSEIAMLSTPSSDRQIILDYALHRTGTPEQWSANDIYEANYANELEQATAGIAELTSGTYGFEVRPSYSSENVAMARELITETLNNNPLFNEIVQRFGMPNVIVVDGPNDWSGIYTNHTNTIHIDKDTYQRYKREALERGPGIRPENEVAIGDTADGRKILTRLLTDGTNPGTLAHEYGHYLHELLRLQKEYGNNRRNHFLYPTDDEQNHPLTQTGIREAFGNSQVGSIGAGRGSTAQNMDALWADSVYAETNPDELFAEAFSALMRMYNEGNNPPEVLVNRYTVDYFADLLGLPTKKAITANKVTLGLPEEELLSDGRPLLPMRPRSVPNVDPKSSNRLHNASEPIAVSYGRNRQGLFSVGDHRFYDSRNPSLYLVGDKRAQQMANDAGQRYVNDRTHSSIVRALSGVQFGLPLVDMPLIGNENSDDLGVLEAVITGEIARLPNNQRSRIELALKDATDISIGINESAKTKEPIYRSIVGGNKNGLKRSLEVGDEFPMPITSFSKDDDSDASVVLKIQNGAKALTIGDENLTQGTFKVLAINDKDGKLSVELEHVETFDPRHDAMRRVTGDDRPNTMRTRGLSSRRYTNSEAAAIEQDRNSRASITSYKRTLSDDDSKMLEELMDYSKISTNNLISSIKDKVERFVQDKITARLVKQEKLMKGLYGDDKPYIDDAKVIKEWALGGPKPTGDKATVLKAAIERAYLHEKKIPIGDEIGTVKIGVEILSGKNIRVEGTVEIEREGRSFVVASFDRTLIAKHDPSRELSPRMLDENIAAVNHNNMMVEPAFKQFGIANLINGHSYAWLARAGFDKIELGAASDGHYVWSLLGFSPSPENHDSRVNSLISPLREELKKFLEGGSDIIPNEATAIRIAWWVRNAEIQGPQAVSLVTLANSFELTKDNKNALVDFFRWNRAGEGGLELRLDDKPTSYMPYHVLPDRATAEFIQSNDNLGLRSRSRNTSTSKLHLINRKDMSQPITREQASYLAAAYRNAEFTHSSEPDFNFSNPRDHTMMPIFEASGYNLQPSLITKANAVALLSKVNDDGKPLYIPISRGYGLNAKTADMRVDAAARQWSTGPRDLSDRYDSLIFGGGDYFSTEPANWSLYYSSEDADGTVKTPFDRSNKSGLLVLVPPAARIGTYDDYLQTRRQLSDLIDPDVPTVSGYQWMDDSFRGGEGLERLFKNYTRANTKEEQIVRRASLFSSNANKPTSAILALIYELEDSKTPENSLEITRTQRLLARPTMPLYGVLNGLDAYETGTGAMVVLNRSAMVSVDEPMSLPEINEIVAEAVSADGKPIHPNFSRKYKQVESDFSPDYSQNFMGSYGDKIKEGKDKAQGLRSRSDKNIWKTLGDELFSGSAAASNFPSEPKSIERVVRQLAAEYNFMTEELKNLESRLENADNDALTPEQVEAVKKDINLVVARLKEKEKTWSQFIGTTNKLSRRHIETTARRTAILKVLKKVEEHLGTEYESNPFVKKLRRELDKIAKLFDTPSRQYIEGSKYDTGNIGLSDATEYATAIRKTLTDIGGSALGRLGFPESENDQDTLMDDEDDALRELMLDAEDAKAISLDEPDFDEPQTPRQSNTPDGVPTDVMRKVKAMLARARHKNTPPAEAEVAERKARDFIGRYRPDLAENDGYMRGLRSRSKPTGLRSGFQPRPMPSNMEQAYYKEKYKNAFGQYNKIQEQMPNADDFFPELIDISTSNEPEIDRARNMSSIGWATKEFDDATNQWIADNPGEHERMMLVADSMDDLIGKLNKVGDEDLISRIGKLNTQLSRGMLTQNEYYSYLSTLMTNHEPEVRDNTNRGLRSQNRGRGLRSQILPIEPQFLPIENLTAARGPKVDTNLQTPKNWEVRTNRRAVRKSGQTRVGQEIVTPLEVQLAIVEDYKDIKKTLAFIAKKHNVTVDYVSFLARQYKLPYRKNIRQNLTGVQRGNIVEAIKNGMPDKEIRETFNITKSVLKRLKYISETGTARALRLSIKKTRGEKAKEEIIKLFNEGLRITDIARRTKTDFKFVGDLLLANTETRPKLIARRDGSDLIPRVRKLFKDGLNITEIKNELKKDYKIIKKIIDEDEELSELQQERIRKRQNLVSIAPELRAFLISGESYDAAMEKFNLTRTQINKFVQTDRKKNKGKPDIPQLPDRRGTRIYRPLKSERDNEIAKLYEQGASRAELMQMFGITTSRLTQILKTQRPKGLKSQQSKVVGYVGSPVPNLGEDGSISGRALSTDMRNELSTLKSDEYDDRGFLIGPTPREKLKKLISKNIASQMSDVTVDEMADFFKRTEDTTGELRRNWNGKYLFYNEDGGVELSEITQFLVNTDGDLIYLGPSDEQGSDFDIKKGQEYYTYPSPEGERALKEAMVSKLVHSWAESSNDSNRISLAIQDTVENLFQTQSARWSNIADVREYITKEVDAILADEKMHKVLKSFVKAQYDATQQYFEAKGIKTVTVFRGMHKNNAKWGTLPESKTRPQEATLNMRPLSSWSADIYVANQFAQEDGEYDDGIVFKCTFPVENVFSVPFTGVGCVDEDEVVVLGKPSKAEYMTGFQGNPYKGENYPETEEDYENKAYEDEVLSWADIDISLDKVDK